MAYWWVSQNKTFKEEYEGGYLWAPIHDKRGAELQHHRNMVHLQEGDIVFSYVNKTIAAVSTVLHKAYPEPQPPEFGDETGWEREGRMADLAYEKLGTPVPLESFLEEIRPHLPDKYSPITSADIGALGYLYALPPRAGRVILCHVENDNTWQAPVQAVETSGESPTEREALVQSRIGQGEFRKKLLDYWQGRCAVSGLGVATLLRASHIKPWSDSNNHERLDVHNGLLLAANYDAAFDAGLLTFTDEGRVHLAPDLSRRQALMLGIDPNTALRAVTAEHQAFLEHHRTHVFKQESSTSAA